MHTNSHNGIGRASLATVLILGFDDIVLHVSLKERAMRLLSKMRKREELSFFATKTELTR